MVIEGHPTTCKMRAAMASPKSNVCLWHIRTCTYWSTSMFLYFYLFNYLTNLVYFLGGKTKRRTIDRLLNK